MSRIALEIALSFAAVALQAVHPAVSYDAGFMYVDPVGIPCVAACLVLGFRTSIRVLLVSIAGILALDPSGVIGALLKLAATLPLLLALQRPSRAATAAFAALAVFLLAGGAGLLARVLGGASMVLGLAAVAAPVVAGAAWWKDLPKAAASPAGLARALVLAILARGCLMVFADLFFAVPVFFHQPLLEAVAALPASEVMWWNAVQAAVDAAGAAAVASASNRWGRLRAGPAGSAR